MRRKSLCKTGQWMAPVFYPWHRALIGYAATCLRNSGVYSCHLSFSPSVCQNPRQPSSAHHWWCSSSVSPSMEPTSAIETRLPNSRWKNSRNRFAAGRESQTTIPWFAGFPRCCTNPSRISKNFFTFGSPVMMKNRPSTYTWGDVFTDKVNRN